MCLLLNIHFWYVRILCWEYFALQSSGPQQALPNVIFLSHVRLVCLYIFQMPTLSGKLTEKHNELVAKKEAARKEAEKLEKKKRDNARKKRSREVCVK